MLLRTRKCQVFEVEKYFCPLTPTIAKFKAAIRDDILHLLAYRSKDFDDSVLCIDDEQNWSMHPGVDIDWHSPILFPLEGL